MDESGFDKLKEFIEKQTGCKEEEITPGARLYDDLGVYGDDACELLVKYGRKFNVDVSKFMAAEYFRGEGDWILPAFIRSILNRPEPEYKTLTVAHLLKGILAGRLDEEVIQGEM